METMYLQLGPHVSELQRLTGLTRLSAMYDSGDLADYQEYLVGLAALTQLHNLKFEFSEQLTVASLLPLTSLTALTEFECRWQPGLDTEKDYGDFSCKQTATWQTPVWVQILERCTMSDCQPEAVCRLARHLAGPEAAAVHRAVTLYQQLLLLTHHTETDRQRECIDEHGQQVAYQGATTAQQAAKIADLQGQMSAQQQVIGQQGVQINYLHGQLSAQQQATTQHGAHVAYLQGQLFTQQGVLAQQAAQIAGLQGQLSAKQHAAAPHAAQTDGQLHAMQSQLHEVLQHRQ